MTVDERRQRIIRILYLRGHETTKKLANELGVSERTIMRDVCALSLKEPIYTLTGRYNGGVYIMPEYYPSAFYFKTFDIKTLNSVLLVLERHRDEGEVAEIIQPFKDLIATYTKPNYKGEHYNE